MHAKLTVVRCSPDHPPHSLPVLLDLANKNGIEVDCAVHIHSDITSNDEEYRERLGNFLPKSKNNVNLTLIWTTSVGRELSFHAAGRSLIGEINLVKYLVKQWEIMSSINILDEARLDGMVPISYLNSED